jgi:hypothetical protein
VYSMRLQRMKTRDKQYRNTTQKTKMVGSNPGVNTLSEVVFDDFWKVTTGIIISTFPCGSQDTSFYIMLQKNSSLRTRPTRSYLDFVSASSLKQGSAGKHIVPHYPNSKPTSLCSYSLMIFSIMQFLVSTRGLLFQ